MADMQVRTTPTTTTATTATTPTPTPARFGRRRNWVAPDAALTRNTCGPEAHFCGYHDLIPWSPAGGRLLCLEAEPLGDVPAADDVARIGVVELDGEARRFAPVAETRAWNWAIGARQHWLDEDRILYNDREGSRFVARILDLGTGKARTLPRAIWSRDAAARWAVAPGFARLHAWYATYGYAGGDDETVVEPAPRDDGIHLIDLERGRSWLVISVAEAVRRCGMFEEGGALPACILTHPGMNPSGTRFCFFLRFPTRDGFVYSVLFVADRDGSRPKVLARELVSHFDWMDDDRLLVWARNHDGLARMRSARWFSHPLVTPVFRGARAIKRSLFGLHAFTGRFHLLDVESGDWEVFADEAIRQDGHPMFSPDREWLVNDSYPDAHRLQHLMVYHVPSNTRIDVARLGSPADYGSGTIRCDLHPRWNRDGTRICVDSTHEGSRQVYTVDVGEVLRRHRRIWSPPAPDGM